MRDADLDIWGSITLDRGMWTAEQIFALSPDAASLKAAKGLLALGKWPLLGFSEATIWGHCQGSGSKPYQVMIDLSGPAFKCSCPSRKFPCKHGLALFLLKVQHEGNFSQDEAPTWLREWMEGRKERSEKKAEKVAAQSESGIAAQADPEAAAKRSAKRLERMVEGAKDLERWMMDLVRYGMADLPTKPASFWRETAARMVDAQAPGLGHAVRSFEDSLHGSQWAQRTVAEMGRTQLLLEAMQRLTQLPDAVQADVRSAAGWPLEKEEVLQKGEKVSDVWRVFGISFEENDRLWERRVWLHARQSGRVALLLDFSHGQKRFEMGFVVGSELAATLAFFPSNHPMRALVVESKAAENAGDSESVTRRWSEALKVVTDGVSANPWISRFPLGLIEVTPVFRDQQWWARDEEGREMKMRLSHEEGWQLMAISGGWPMWMFGEGMGEVWRPLSAWHPREIGTPAWCAA